MSKLRHFNNIDRQGFLWTMGSVIAFGLTGFVDKIGTNHISSPLWYSSISLLAAFAISLIYAVRVRKISLVNYFKLHRTSFWTLPSLGILSSGIFILLRFYGLQNSTATFVSLSQVLTSVLTVVFAAVVFKEKLPKVINFLLPVILIATYFFSTGTVQPSTMKNGDLLIIIAAVILAVGNLIGKHATQSFDAAIVTMARVFFGLSFVLVSMLIINPGFIPLNLNLIFPLLSGLIIGINFMCYYEGVKRCGVSFTTAFLMLSPLLTKVLSLLFLHETLNWLQIACFFTILIAGYIVDSSTNNNASPVVNKTG